MDLSRQLDLAFDRLDEGRDSEAIRICEEILACDPDFYGALYLCGSILGAQGRHVDAREHLERAIAQRPEKPLAHFNLAKILLDAGEAEAALSRINAYLERAAGDPEAYAVQGSALLALGRPAEAQAVFDQAIALNPDKPQSHYNRGNSLKAQGRMAAALEAFNKAISLDPRVAAFHLNCGVVVHALERFDEAISCYEAALKLEPDCADAFSNCGISLHATERFDEALASFGKAIALDPAHSEARANRAYTFLLLGHFADGWDEYEWRVKSAEYERIALGENRRFLQRALQFPRRDALEGQRLILFGEQGVGDVIMFSSMLDDALRIASRIDLVVDRRLCALLKRSFPQVGIFAIEEYGEAEIPSGAICLMIGSLGSLLRRERESFPGTAYLHADPTKIAVWRDRLGATLPKRIGISWRGGMAHTRRTARSLPLHEFLGLFARADMTFVSLQHNASGDEIEGARQGLGVDLRAFPAGEMNDFSDLAALIASLDAVVTVQNSNVHLSGALGTPCLTILPAVPEWRYGLDETRMHWYGSVELFRREAVEGLGNLHLHLSNRLAQLLPSG